MRNACRSSSPSSTLPHTASTRVTCAVRAAGTVRPGAHEAKRRVLARRVLVDPRALAADGDDVTGEIGLVASRARFQVAKLLHALVAVIPAEEGDDSTLTLNAQLLQHLWRDRLTQDHAVEPRAHPGGRAAAWRTGHEAERYRKKSQRHRHRYGVWCLFQVSGARAGRESPWPSLPLVRLSFTPLPRNLPSCSWRPSGRHAPTPVAGEHSRMRGAD